MSREGAQTVQRVGIVVLVALSVGMAGCAGIIGSGYDGPVVDNGGDNPDRVVTVDLTIEDESGNPVSGAVVILRDRGGTPDDRQGTTGPEGRLRFIEGVGPPPCNSQTIVLPAYDTSANLGCNEGGTTLERTITVRA